MAVSLKVKQKQRTFLTNLRDGVSLWF